MFPTNRNKPFGFETSGNIMKNTHQNWEPGAFMQRLPSSPSWLAIPRPLFTEGEGRSCCPAATRVWGFPGEACVLNPAEDPPAPPTPQVVPNVPGSGQRRPLPGTKNLPKCLQQDNALSCHHMKLSGWGVGPGSPRKHAVISLQILPPSMFFYPKP